MKRVLKKTLTALVLGGLFLLPFFSWIWAESLIYHDPAGLYSITPPEGWKIDDSGHMGKGVVMKGPAGPAGVEPVIHLLHEAAGIVTLDVQWHTRLGQIRYDLQRVKFLSLEDHEEDTPPYYQARYSYVENDTSHVALVRLSMHEKRFFFITANAPEGEFESLRPLFEAVLASFTPAQGN